MVYVGEVEAQLREDLSFLRERVLGVLLFGSAVSGEAARDLDVCLVAGRRDAGELLFEVFRAVDVRGKRYDVRLFEELPVFMRHEVLKRHRVVIARDVPALYEYLYFHRKFCADMEARRRIAKPGARRAPSA